MPFPAAAAALVALAFPIGGALYFIDMPKFGKPKITGKSKDEGMGLPEAEHKVDLQDPPASRSRPPRRPPRRVYVGRL